MERMIRIYRTYSGFQNLTKIFTKKDTLYNPVHVLPSPYINSYDSPHGYCECDLKEIEFLIDNIYSLWRSFLPIGITFLIICPIFVFFCGRIYSVHRIYQWLEEEYIMTWSSIWHTNTAMMHYLLIQFTFIHISIQWTRFQGTTESSRSTSYFDILLLIDVPLWQTGSIIHFSY